MAEKKYATLSVAAEMSNAHEEQGAVATAEPITATGLDNENASEGRFLEVVAPADLPEDYSFEVDVEGRCLMVTVPAGGAKAGRVMSVPFPEEWTAVPTVTAPVGRWRDGLCECFRHGVCHALLCNAIYCPLIAVGQIMQRLKLTWLANEGPTARTSTTFRTIFWITISYYIARFVLSISFTANTINNTITWVSNPENKGKLPPQSQSGSLMHLLRLILPLAFAIFGIVIVTKTRNYIRTKYQIPESSCHGCEDCCCAFWCTCCAVAQMGRHTADYDTYAATCCTETGQPGHVPSVMDRENRRNRASSGNIV